MCSWGHRDCWSWGSLHLLIKMLQTDEKFCFSHQHRFCHTLVPSFLVSTVERRDEEEEGPWSGDLCVRGGTLIMFYSLGLYCILNQYPLLAGLIWMPEPMSALFSARYPGQRSTAMLFSSVEIDGRSFPPRDSPSLATMWLFSGFWLDQNKAVRRSDRPLAKLVILVNEDIARDSSLSFSSLEK